MRGDPVDPDGLVEEAVRSWLSKERTEADDRDLSEYRRFSLSKLLFIAACAVIAVMADGSYVRLSPEGSGNTRTFHTVQSKVIVRLLGDYDGDGSVETLDLAKANKALLGSGVGELEALIMGADNGCELETVDLARLNKKLINDTKFDW